MLGHLKDGSCRSMPHGSKEPNRSEVRLCSYSIPPKSEAVVSRECFPWEKRKPMDSGSLRQLALSFLKQSSGAAQVVIKNSVSWPTMRG